MFTKQDQFLRIVQSAVMARAFHMAARWKTGKDSAASDGHQTLEAMCKAVQACHFIPQSLHAMEAANKFVTVALDGKRAPKWMQCDTALVEPLDEKSKANLFLLVVQPTLAVAASFMAHQDPSNKDAATYSMTAVFNRAYDATDDAFRIPSDMSAAEAALDFCRFHIFDEIDLPAWIAR